MKTKNYKLAITHFKKSIELDPKFADVGQKLEMDILDKKYNVTVIEDSPYDPKNEKLKQ